MLANRLKVFIINVFSSIIKSDYLKSLFNMAVVYAEYREQLFKSTSHLFTVY